MIHFRLNLVRTLCLAALVAVPGFAQRDMGTLLGVVTDPSGAAVPGARITITEDATGVTDRVESDAAGNNFPRCSSPAPTPSQPNPRDSRDRFRPAFNCSPPPAFRRTSFWRSAP